MDPVLPSFLAASPAESYVTPLFNNVSLKEGQVIRIHYPDLNDKQSIQTTTYDVLVVEGANHGTKTNIYYGVVLSNMFGGLADYCDYSLRANVMESSENKDQFLLTGQLPTEQDYNSILGCRVILACISGSTTDAVIIGGLAHPLNSVLNRNYKIPDKETGHFLNFMFNGVKININKYGELFVQRQGATNADGSIAGATDAEENTNLDKANSFIKINQDGEIILSTTAKANANDIDVSELDNAVVIDKDGNINIKIKSGQTLELKNADSDVLMTLGAGEQSAAVAEQLKTLYTQLKAKLDIFDTQLAAVITLQNVHIHNIIAPVPGTPTSPPIPTAAPTPSISAPGWDSNIESKCLKLPK